MLIVFLFKEHLFSDGDETLQDQLHAFEQLEVSDIETLVQRFEGQLRADSPVRDLADDFLSGQDAECHLLPEEHLGPCGVHSEASGYNLFF